MAHTIRAHTRSTFRKAVRENRAVHLVYTDAKGDTTERTLAHTDETPLTIRRSRAGERYAVGHCTLRNERRSFRLDRVISAKIV